MCAGFIQFAVNEFFVMSVAWRAGIPSTASAFRSTLATKDPQETVKFPSDRPAIAVV